MPTNFIDGIPVEFPHTAYPCQITYMQNVLQALKKGENALLESPTGTGKTLSLLCAALAWRTAEMGRHQLKEQTGNNASRSANYDQIMERVSSVSGSVGSNTAFKSVNSASGSVARLQSVLDESLDYQTSSNCDVDDALYRPPLIIYASRTHSQLTQVIRELRRTTYRPRIAIVGSREQMCIHPNVLELSSSSAQSAVCSRLTRKKACEFHARVPEALNHLKKRNGTAVDENNCEASASSSNSCNNSSIMDMEDLIEFASLHKACPYYTSRELLGEADLVFMPYNYLLDKKTRGSSLLSFKDAIVIFDEAHNVEGSCYDAVSCEISSEDLNLAERELTHCLELVDSPFFISSLSAFGGVNKDTVVAAQRFVSTLNGNLCKISVPAGSSNNNSNFFSEPGDSIFKIFEEGQQEGPEGKVEIEFLLKSFEEIVKLYLEDQYNRRSGKRSAFQSIVSALRTIYGMADENEKHDNGETAEDPAGLYARLLDRNAKRKELLDRSRAFYRMVVTENSISAVSSSGNNNSKKQQSNNRIMAYWCFNPGVVMKDLIGMGVRSIVLTSGTLSPMKSFMQEMQIDFKHVLENDHVIDNEQVFATVVGLGPSGKNLNSSFNQRDSKEYQQELGLSIVNFCRVIPDGVLVFFPSYQVMDSCLNYWQICKPGGGGATSSTAIPNAQTIFQMIQSIKIPVIEPKNKGELSSAMDRYEKIIDDGKESRGAIFFAVCRGKVSEGLDFSDAKGRAVIVTGIPYPPFKDPKIILKKQYLQDQKQGINGNNFLSGADWYNQQASRAVNQALGRVIRHRNDFGAILLCDERFGNPGTLSQLSKWLRGRVSVAASFGEVQGGLARFFKDKPKHSKVTIINDQCSMEPSMTATTLMNNSSSNSYNMRNELQMQKFKIDQVPFSLKSPQTTMSNTSEMFKFSSNTSAPATSSTKKFNWFNSTTSDSKQQQQQQQQQKQQQTNDNSSSKPPNNDKQKKAQEYLELVKTSLPKDQFRNFMGLLKMYRANQISIDKLLTDLVEVVLKTPGISNSQALLEGFETFVPSKHRALFDTVLTDYRRAAAAVVVVVKEEAQDHDASSLDSPDDDSNNSSLNSKRRLHADFIGKRPELPIEPISLKYRIATSNIVDQLIINAPSPLNKVNAHESSCPICKDALNDPFKAKCSHVACFECWSAWLTRTLECPLCRQRTRISQLRRISMPFSDGENINENTIK